MASSTKVNSQVTDAVEQVNVDVLGDAPAVATGNFALASAQALSNAAHNATTGKQDKANNAQANAKQKLDRED